MSSWILGRAGIEKDAMTLFNPETGAIISFTDDKKVFWSSNEDEAKELTSYLGFNNEEILLALGLGIETEMSILRFLRADQKQTRRTKNAKQEWAL